MRGIVGGDGGGRAECDGREKGRDGKRNAKEHGPIVRGGIVPFRSVPRTVVACFPCGPDV
jgi:hypothetical protein